jgi:DMSO/TMAO reductase YedYZ molybdopterin-dependent catalytic subunit
MGEQESAEPSTRDRYLKRRRFLLATGAVAGGALIAGCSGGGTQAEPQPTQSPSETGTETATPEETPTETPTEQGQTLQERYPGLRILSPEPENAEARERATYTTQITSLEEFYIRNHYPTPDIAENEWTLSLTGMIGQEVELSIQDLKRQFPTTTVFHVMQCSGNGRSYFDPQVGGNQWTFGAVGNAEWTGTPVSAVLERYGADTSPGMWVSFMGGEAPEGEDIFTRSIPMQKVMDDCILAYEMNGAPLATDHGFPVRLVVPGWYGNNNVKWLNRMHVMDMMVYGPDWETPEQQLYTHWQQYSYRIIPEQDEEPQQYRTIDDYDTYEQMQNPDQVRNAYINDQLVKSLIGYPGQNSTVTPQDDGTIEVIGVAWAGENAVETVEISDNEGTTWNEAEFFQPDLGPFSWRLFRYVWSPSPGEYTLVSRATDSLGRTQPSIISTPEEGLRGIQDDMFPWNQDGYIANAYMPLGVNVTVE